MYLTDTLHLTYCTNIHPGETWPAVFRSLEQYVLPLRHKLAPTGPFGIGLRLSNRASEELSQGEDLVAFRDWLDAHGCYVFTMNGFPYGDFHGEMVKDQVHYPDWTTRRRLNYTIRLCNQLAALLPDGLHGGVSTSPLSYKHWHPNPDAREKAMLQATQHLLELADHLYQIEERTGQHLHLDIEPEPDGLIEDSGETIDYFNQYLVPAAVDFYSGRLRPDEAGEIVRRHINLCYDVCHFAVEYERPATALQLFRDNDIRIGKVQISAALKALLPPAPADRGPIRRQFEAFNESTYLHQVIERDDDGNLTNYPDLPQALPHLDKPEAREWRTHFHVPIFVDHYHHLQSTRDDIRQVLALLKDDPFTEHLEVETYTWEVLPKALQLELTDSIERELRWVVGEWRGEV